MRIGLRRGLHAPDCIGMTRFEDIPTIDPAAIRLFEAVAWLHALPAAEPETHPDAPLPLADAVLLPELGGQVPLKTLRAAIAAGALEAEMHGRSIRVTRAGIARWREGCRIKPKASTAAPRPVRRKPAPLPATSSTLAARAAIEALRAREDG